MASPSATMAHRPMEVVRPLIWLRELYRMELLLMMATPITAAAETMGTLPPRL